MSDVLSVFADQLGTLRWVLGFVLLPALYLKECAEVNKDVTSHLKEMASFLKKHPDAREEISNHLRIFELEGWLVLAFGVLFAGVFALGDVGESSSHLNTGASCLKGSCAKEVRGILNAFGFALGVGAVLYVQWCKAQAFALTRRFMGDQLDSPIGDVAGELPTPPPGTSWAYRLDHSRLSQIISE